MKKILITGVTGFAGSYLAELLISLGYTVHGTTRNRENGVQDKLLLHTVDLLDSIAVDALLSEVGPDWIFHLAALASPRDSFRSPKEYLINNIEGELNLLEVVRKRNLNTRILLITSAEVYGLVKNEDLPISETVPFRPVSPYGVSKIAQDMLGLQYVLSHKLDIIRVRPFGHIGPRLSADFAASAFAKQIVEIEKGKKNSLIKVGNLESKRDLTDVRDVVKAYLLLMEKGVSGEVYNLGTGISRKTGDILQTLVSLSSVQITSQVDPSLLRPSDIPELCCDNTKLVQLTGWKPEIAFEQSLKDTLDYWREIL